MHNGYLWHTVVLLYTHKEILQLDGWEESVPVDYCMQAHKEPTMKKSLAFIFGTFFLLPVNNGKLKKEN